MDVIIFIVVCIEIHVSKQYRPSSDAAICLHNTQKKSGQKGLNYTGQGIKWVNINPATSETFLTVCKLNISSFKFIQFATEFCTFEV